MKNFTSAARLTVLVLSAAGFLTGCKPAEAPQFSPAPGSYVGPRLVSMSTPTFGATIVYTTDGSAPSCVKHKGTIYSEPVLVDKDTVLRAMACSLLRAESLITTGSYVIRPPELVAAPTFAPAAGTYISTQAVTIATATADAQILFTSDGSTPTCTTGTVYTGAIEVAQSVTLNAIACKKDAIDSAVTTAAYVITPPAAAPVSIPRPAPTPACNTSV